MGQFNYFKDSEIKNLDLEFVAMLDKARHVSNVPYIITSGYRTPERNFEIGGADKSLHTRGLAVDLRCNSNHILGCMLKGLYSAGFEQIGIYFGVEGNGPFPTHLHVELDREHPGDAVWLKIEGT